MKLFWIWASGYEDVDSESYYYFLVLALYQWSRTICKCGSKGGGGGDRGSGKWQVIWLSIGNKQLDPPGKCWTPSGTLKNDSFLWNWPFDFGKISWGLKKTKKKKQQKTSDCQSFFCQTGLDPPWRKFLDPGMICAILLESIMGNIPLKLF